MDKAQALRPFRSLIAGPTNDTIRAWKESGRRVIGHFCSYVPVELITAAGMLPVRLHGAGSSDSSEADAYLSSRCCTYVRHVMNQVLIGGYDFLDGEISLNTCDHVRRAYDLMRHKTGVGFHGFLSVPRNTRPSLFDWYLEEIRNLKAQLEAHFGLTIEDDALRAAIALHNRLRQALGELDQLRARPEPPLTGAEMLMVQVAATVTPPEHFLSLLEPLTKAVTDAPGRTDVRARLLLVGALLDEPRFVATVESQGAHVVGDRLCYGSRSFESLVPESGDPLTAMARTTFFRVPCARMIGNFPDRYTDLLRACEQRQVDAVVCQRLMFCDPWGGEAHHLRHRLRRQQIPALFLEREYGVAAVGQIKTRVQALLETMESR